jgi:hypothetical protein
MKFGFAVVEKKKQISQQYFLAWLFSEANRGDCKY